MKYYYFVIAATIEDDKPKFIIDDEVLMANFPRPVYDEDTDTWEYVEDEVLDFTLNEALVKKLGE